MDYLKLNTQPFLTVNISVISGGGILSLPKYEPLQGAAQGLVVYFANHLAHAGEGDSPKSKNQYKKIEGSQADVYDGKLTDDMNYILNGEDGNYLSRFAEVFSLAWSESTSMEKFGFVSAIVPQKALSNATLSIVKSSKAEQLFIKGLGKINKALYHSSYKDAILKNAGKFEHIVGKNPNTAVENGKIVLEGIGAFKGKTFPTNLNANDYYK